MLFYTIILGILLIAVLGISYYAFRIAFLAPPPLDPEHYFSPVGKQYDEVREGIRKSVDKMATRKYEAVTITSFDGSKLFARYYPGTNGAPVQILFHGYKSCSLLDCSGGTYLAVDCLNHNVLVVDQRSHGQSNGRVITFGIKERKDCLRWIAYAKERFGADIPIILSGLSMGAATVLMACDLNLPSNVKGIIADCPYSSPKEIILKVARDLHFPPRLMLPFIWLGGFLFGHFNLFESSAINAIETCNIPILILHGDADALVPYEMARSLQSCGAKDITLETFEKAGHGLSYIVNPEKYEKVVIGFIKKCLDNH